MLKCALRKEKAQRLCVCYQGEGRQPSTRGNHISTHLKDVPSFEAQLIISSSFEVIFGDGFHSELRSVLSSLKQGGRESSLLKSSGFSLSDSGAILAHWDTQCHPESEER